MPTSPINPGTSGDVLVKEETNESITILFVVFGFSFLQRPVTVNLPSEDGGYELKVKGKDVIFRGETVSNVKSIGTSSETLIILRENGDVLEFRND